MPKTTEMALPVPTKLLLETSPDAAMLFTPIGHLSLFVLSAEAGHCQKWHHEAESLSTDISAMGPKDL